MNKIEEEYDRRRLSNEHDRRLTLLILILIPLCLLARLAGNPTVFQMFLAQDIGKAILAACFICYVAAVAGFCLIQRRLAD